MVELVEHHSPVRGEDIVEKGRVCLLLDDHEQRHQADHARERPQDMPAPGLLPHDGSAEENAAVNEEAGKAVAEVRRAGDGVIQIIRRRRGEHRPCQHRRQQIEPGLLLYGCEAEKPLLRKRQAQQHVKQRDRAEGKKHGLVRLQRNRVVDITVQQTVAQDLVFGEIFAQRALNDEYNACRRRQHAPQKQDAVCAAFGVL